MRKQELLTAVVADLQSGGIGDRSLRDIAAAVGTSHRMLIHHFGSREGMLAAVVAEVESQQRRFLASLDPEPEVATVAMWERLSDPSFWPAEQLFFECYVRACRGEIPFASMLPGLVDDWIDAVVALGFVWPGAGGSGHAGARLGLAVFRGLLLDLVATRDRAGVDAAFEEYRALMSGAASPRS